LLFGLQPRLVHGYAARHFVEQAVCTRYVLRPHAAGTPRAASGGVESPLLRKRIAAVAGGPPVAAA